MHFSIPDTQEFRDDAGNAYLGYNIHINGLFHCAVRYKQLRNLHEQFLKDYNVPLPTFPPKKFFPLTNCQQEERRCELEKYIQGIGQNTKINNSTLLNGFLLNAQLESNKCKQETENFDIYLYNGSKVTLEVLNTEHSGQILKKICRHINLPERYDSYFSLFLILQNEGGGSKIVRKLQNFESPVIIQKNVQKTATKIILGKWYWDIDQDDELMTEPVALNLLYMQTSAEIEKKWIVISEETKVQLDALFQCSKKKEYLNIVRESKYYGYIQFAPCLCDYPQIGTSVQVAIGGDKLSLRILKNEKEEQEAVFSVTRMRCWRITTLNTGVDRSNECSLELSFEYLIDKKKLQWITISSEQAILISVCLQSMIDELLLKKTGGIKIQEMPGRPWTYVTRNGHSRIVKGSPTIEDLNKPDKVEGSPHTKEPFLKNLSDRIAIVKDKKANTIAEKPVVKSERIACGTIENHAFNIIGDEDL